MLNLLVALPAEAKPLIRHLKLQRQQPDGDFPLYQRDAIQLLLTGPGKEAAYKATRYLHAIADTNDALFWVNIGIAGHPNAAIGDALLMHCIHDQATGRVWSLPTVPNLPLPQADLITVNEPADEYPENAVFDMEAAGMMAALSLYQQLDRAVVLKVISDNNSHPTSKINGRLVKSLLQNQLSTIDNLLHAIGS